MGFSNFHYSMYSQCRRSSNKVCSCPLKQSVGPSSDGRIRGRGDARMGWAGGRGDEAGHDGAARPVPSAKVSKSIVTHKRKYLHIDYLPKKITGNLATVLLASTASTLMAPGACASLTAGAGATPTTLRRRRSAGAPVRGKCNDGQFSENKYEFDGFSFEMPQGWRQIPGL